MARKKRRWIKNWQKYSTDLLIYTANIYFNSIFYKFLMSSWRCTAASHISFKLSDMYKCFFQITGNFVRTINLKTNAKTTLSGRSVNVATASPSKNQVPG